MIVSRCDATRYREDSIRRRDPSSGIYSWTDSTTDRHCRMVARRRHIPRGYRSIFDSLRCTADLLHWIRQRSKPRREMSGSLISKILGAEFTAGAGRDRLQIQGPAFASRVRFHVLCTENLIELLPVKNTSRSALFALRLQAVEEGQHQRSTPFLP